MPKGYVGWLLPDAERRRLLERFPPAYRDVIAHHVTHSHGVTCGHRLPTERRGTVVGVADDGRGCQALVVEIGGTTDRPGGGSFHITWSLDRAAGRRPVDSNAVLAGRGWTAVERVDVALEPRFFPF